MDKIIFERITESLSIPNLEKLLQVIMDTAIEVSQARRGFLILKEKRGKLSFKVAHNVDKSVINEPKFEISYTIIRDTIKQKQVMFYENVSESPKYFQKSSILKLGLLSVLTVPLIVSGKVIGLIYLDNNKISGIFTADMIEGLSAFAEKVSSILNSMNRIHELKQSNNELRQELLESKGFKKIITCNPKMKEILDQVDTIAKSDASVIIYGESGTGKELIAASVHLLSNRSYGPFYSVNCGALSENLLEAELFGVKKGAFTGATEDKEGYFAVTDGGTLFLDEIGDCPPSLQVKLLRVLETRTYSRVGGVEERDCNVRIISATNKNLIEMMKEKTFRDDLYFRLNVFDVTLPPLRERKEDIPLLVQSLINQFSAEMEKEDVTISEETLNILTAYDWPGNIRELKNAIQRAMILCNSNEIGIQNLPPHLISKTISQNIQIEIPKDNEEFKQLKEKAKEAAVSQVERLFITDILKRTNGNISKASELGQINRSYLQRKIGEHNIDPSQFS